MTLDVTIAVDIIEVMENYIDAARPAPHIRHKIDIGYEITGQSVILQEIRPLWGFPGKYQTIDYAKATFVKSKGVWKIYWSRADSEWHPYTPHPIVHELRDFLHLVEEDKHYCFRG